jgi:hypothetical protein
MAMSAFDYNKKPKVRLTGSGGNNGLSSLSEKMVLVGIQSPAEVPGILRNEVDPLGVFTSMPGSK